MQTDHVGFLFGCAAACGRTPRCAAHLFLRVVFVLCVGLSGTLTAAPIHVAKTGNDTNDGLTYETAKLTMQAGIDTALAGGHVTVLVYDGDYQATTVQMTNGPLTVKSVNGADVTLMRKTSGNRATINIDHPQAVLDGFTLYNGQNGDGGAVVLKAGMVKNCIIRNNNGIYRGGGVYMEGGVLTNSVLYDNKLLYSSDAYGGGAVYMSGGLVVDCIITNNSAASNRGGGVRILNAGEVRNTQIANNRTTNRAGGGIYMNAGLVQNCLIADNVSASSGGGFYMTGGLVESCTIAGNVSASEGGGVRMTGGTLRNCVVSRNTGNTDAARDLWRTGGDVEYSCVIPATAGEGNIAADPEFTNPATSDYRPRPGSPLIDAGTNQAWMATAFDYDGRPRILNARVDIGVFEKDAAGGPLRANFLASAREGYTSLGVEFTAYTAGSNTTGLVYYWDFGNGTLSGADRVVVTNQFGPGIYTVALTVTNALDESDTIAKAGHIKVGPLSIYVSPTGSDTAPYDSWEKAATDINFAFAQAGSNDTIYLAGGEYPLTESISWTRSFVNVRGSYEGISAEGPGERDIDRWPTVLRRDGSVARLRIMNIIGVTNGVLEGVVVRDAYSDRYGATFSGAGIYIENSANMWIAGCHLLDNVACHEDGGGGMFAWNSSGVITNCAFRGNDVDASWYNQDRPGAGLHLSGGAWQVIDSVFSGNGRVDRSTLNNHLMRMRGAGIYVTSGTHHLRNCALYGNGGGYVSATQGSALYVAGGTVTADFLTIVGNRDAGAQRAGGSLAIANSILWDNGADVLGTVTLTHCNVQDGTGQGANGNVSDDPLFTRGLYLGDGSPSRDAGSGNAADFGMDAYTTRLDGAPDGGVADMGFHYREGILAHDVLYVSQEGDDANSGLTADQPLRSVTRALWKARDGTRILLAQGNYNLVGGETFPLYIDRPGQVIEGAGRSLSAIDATGANEQAIQVRGSPDARLRALTVRGASASGQWRSGAGISVVQATATIDDCRIADNLFTIGTSDQEHGSGIGARYSRVTVINCLVEANRITAAAYTCAAKGAGIGSFNTDLRLADSVIIENMNSPINRGYTSVSAQGAGLYLSGGTCLAHNLVIARNDNHGTRSTRANWGDGIYITGGAEVRFVNITLADNTGDGDDPEGLHVDDGDVTVRSSILWSNVVDVVGALNLSWSNIEDGTGEGMNGNLSLDPKFADHVYYHLMSVRGRYEDGYFSGGTWNLERQSTDMHSPCIDAGAPGDPYHREPWPHGQRVNMGAYGNSPVASLSVVRGTLIRIK